MSVKPVDRLSASNVQDRDGYRPQLWIELLPRSAAPVRDTDWYPIRTAAARDAVIVRMEG